MANRSVKSNSGEQNVDAGDWVRYCSLPRPLGVLADDNVQPPAFHPVSVSEKKPFEPMSAGCLYKSVMVNHIHAEKSGIRGEELVGEISKNNSACVHGKSQPGWVPCCNLNIPYERLCLVTKFFTFVETTGRHSHSLTDDV